MRAVVQRVKRAKVTVEGKTKGKIDAGFVVLLGVGQEDTEEDAKYLAEKIANLRVFSDDQGKMNMSLLDKGYSVLAISQFTLYGDCRKGRRPGFGDAMPPDEADRLYNKFVQLIENLGVTVATGQFQAEMDVELINHGPVTMLLDSKKNF
ncbi:D-tyrosyl-tRNA(Tyr) deacylase [Desulfitispora alkaliphila]|uniref:D-aminoacyl-tRNA deacylase n=1 Tax=Desulfitispora alkaliphila TaxID=622674 RepID=UPI003D24B2EE